MLYADPDCIDGVFTTDRRPLIDGEQDRFGSDCVGYPWTAHSDEWPVITARCRPPIPTQVGRPFRSISAEVACRGRHTLSRWFGSSRDLLWWPQRRGLDGAATDALGGKATFGGMRRAGDLQRPMAAARFNQSTSVVLIGGARHIAAIFSRAFPISDADDAAREINRIRGRKRPVTPS